MMNYARNQAAQHFIQTFKNLSNQVGISERQFAAVWLSVMNCDHRISKNGWYDSPLRSIEDPHLPQISFHYILVIEGGNRFVLDEINSMIKLDQ